LPRSAIAVDAHTPSLLPWRARRVYYRNSRLLTRAHRLVLRARARSNTATMIPIAEPTLDGNELVYLTDCIRTGWISSRGAYVQRFEQAMASWCGVKHGIATASGTSALHLALLALGIGPQDEVIVPALCYVATANAVSYTGARPVFVDVDPETWNLDLRKLEGAVTAQTRAILAVHLYSHPLDMRLVSDIAERHNLWVIEDACEAHGSQVRGARVGGLGDVGCFSFFGNKVITTGEGGMLVTDSDEIAASAVSLRDQATAAGTYWHARIGFNYRLTNLQAAVGLAQLERVDEFVQARQRLASNYGSLLSKIPGIGLYAEPSWSKSVCWLYSVLVRDEFALSRNELIDRLARRGIETKPFFVPLPRLPMYDSEKPYPAATYLSEHGISLPTHVGLHPEQVAQIVQAIGEAAQGA
jgi:perosamine synthetase